MDRSPPPRALEAVDIPPGVVPRPSSCRTDRGQKAEYHGQKVLICYRARRWRTAERTDIPNRMPFLTQPWPLSGLVHVPAGVGSPSADLPATDSLRKTGVRWLPNRRFIKRQRREYGAGGGGRYPTFRSRRSKFIVAGSSRTRSSQSWTRPDQMQWDLQPGKGVLPAIVGNHIQDLEFQ
jgi:hypothetical protein